MPRKNPLLPTEAAICARLRRFREGTLLSRVAFAREAGIDSSTLANLEHERARLRYGVARSVCIRFGLNPVWLAGDKTDFVTTDVAADWFLTSIDDEEPFSRAYRDHLRAILTNSFGELSDELSEFINLLRNVLQIVEAIQKHAMHAQPFGWKDLAATVGPALRKFTANSTMSLHGKVPRIADLRSSQSKIRFDSISEIDTNPPTAMGATIERPLWEKLRRRLVDATREPGAKANLSRQMGVSKQLVNAWLSGAAAPNAETTLALNEWVSAVRAETTTTKKSAGNAVTRPAPKTRESNYAKAKSNQKAKRNRNA